MTRFTLVVFALVAFGSTAHAQNRVDTVAPPTSTATPEQTQSVSAEELRTNGVATVEDAVMLLTGAQAVPGTSTATKLSIDGLPPGYITVMRNGVPIGRSVGGPNGPGVDLSSLPIDPESVERIDVRRGIGPSGTSGVVINIVTSRKSQLSATSRIGAHTGGVHRSEVVASGQVPFGNWAAHAEASVLDRNGADVDLDGQLDTPSGQTYSAVAGVGWRANMDNLDLEFRFGTTQRRVDGGAAPLDDSVSSTEFGVSANGKVQKRWGRIRHTTWGGRNDHDFSKIVRDSGFVRPKAQTTAYRLGHATETTFFVGSHDLSIGLDARGEWVEREGETGAFDDAFIGEAAFGVGERWYLNDHVELSARARAAFAEPWGAAGEAEVGAAFNLAGGWFGNVTISQSRRLPTTEELYLFFDHSEVGYSVVGNPELGPETLRSAATEWGIGRSHWGASVSGFGHVIDDGIITETRPGATAEFSYVNGGRLLLAGVRAGVDVRPGAGLRFDVAHTFQPIARDDSGDRIPLRARHNLRAEVSGRWLDDVLGARTWAVGRIDTFAPQGAPDVPDVLELNAGIMWRPISWMETSIEVRNLGDARHPTWGPAPGRFAMATLRLTR